MNVAMIASRYGKALLMFVQQSGRSAEVYAQACRLSGIFSSLPEFSDAVLRNPDLDEDRKVSIMEMALAEPMSDGLRRFVALVQQRRRMELFARMLDSFIGQYRKINHIKVGKITTAVPVPGLRNDLQDRLGSGGDTVILDERIDPSILGGVIVEIDDLMMDGSVSGRLRRVGRELVNRNNRLI